MTFGPALRTSSLSALVLAVLYRRRCGLVVAGLPLGGAIEGSQEGSCE